jgi:hypothetical protein
MSSSIKWNKIFYDFKTNVHLVGFYSILSLMMQGTMNVKKGNRYPDLTAKCNLLLYIIQHKPKKFELSKSILGVFFLFLCFLHVSNPRVFHLQEDSCICSYGMVCCTCIGISSLVGRRVCNLSVVNKHFQASAAKHMPISHVKMKVGGACEVLVHYRNLTSSLRFSDSNLVSPKYIPDWLVVTWVACMYRTNTTHFS